MSVGDHASLAIGAVGVCGPRVVNAIVHDDVGGEIAKLGVEADPAFGLGIEEVLDIEGPEVDGLEEFADVAGGVGHGGLPSVSLMVSPRRSGVLIGQSPKCGPFARSRRSRLRARVPSVR
jgi:hypothetical protein